MTVINFKNSICLAIGMVCSFIARLFGGWDKDIAALIIFMAVDFIMGLIVAGVFKNSGKSENGALDSRAGWKGLCKKAATLLCVLVAYWLDVLLGTDYIRTAAIIGFCANEGLSILENLTLMGVPFPPAFKKAIEVVKSKGDDIK